MDVQALANAVIRRVHPNETVTIYRCVGQGNVRGEVKPVYAVPVEVRAQVQTEREDAQQIIGESLAVVVTRKFWLQGTPLDRPEGINRPEGTGGDMIRREDGTWWLVTAVLEDFTGAGWTSVRGTLQTAPPEPDCAGGA
jgi:hypothetical protein